MTYRNFSLRKLALVVVCACVAHANLASAQESAYKDLDDCTKKEQIKSTMKGVATGLLAGLGAAFFSGKSDKAGEAALLGGVAGGAIGFATAYYNAIGNCQKLNPSWIPESSIVRDPVRNYTQVKAENRYRQADGIVVVTKKVDMPQSARPGEVIKINSTFDVMTPDDAQTEIVLNRQLFAVVNGQETLIPIPARTTEERTVEAGRSIDSVSLPITPEAVVGTAYRVQFSVASRGGAPSVISRMIKII